MIRMIASDLDGTLLEPVEHLPDGLMETIQRLTDMGILFVAASGRQYDNMRRLFAQVSGKIGFVCENGALSMMGGEVVNATPIPRDMAIDIIHTLEKLPVSILVSGRHTCYVKPENRAFTDDMVYRLRNTTAVVEELDNLDDVYLKVSAFAPEGTASFATALIEQWSDKLNAVVSGKCWFDFGVASKANGIQAFVDKLALKPSEMLAFGDQFNDVSMLRMVGYPYLMESASPELKAMGFRSCHKVLPVLQEVVRLGGKAPNNL